MWTRNYRFPKCRRFKGPGIILGFRLTLCGLCICPPVMAADGPVKEPNVAGGFYPSDPKELSGSVEAFLNAVPRSASQPITIAIAPHAGYRYSGRVAAHTFAAVAEQQYRTIVILAPSHFFPLRGAAIWPQGRFRTPLGDIEVDEDLSRRLMEAAPAVQAVPEAFNQEHALEVELPFLQKVYSGFKIVPVLLGQPDFAMCEQVALALQKALADRHDILVLISSDMSHYKPYADAVAMDQGTLKAIAARDVAGFWKGHVSGLMEMCGFVPVTIGLMLSNLLGLDQARVLAYANSGDVTGDKDQVVGYGSVVFYKSSPGPSPAVAADFSPQERQALLGLARQSLEQYVKTGNRLSMPANLGPEFKRIQGAFVTLMKNGQLRGCIGTVVGQKPLAQTVIDMAVAAASEDPRFSPVTAAELAEIKVEISALSVPRRVRDAGEIVLGRHGVILLGEGGHQGIFLPQVATETGWSKEQFLSELSSQKAGLPPDAWKSALVQLYTFTAEVFGEE